MALISKRCRRPSINDIYFHIILLLTLFDSIQHSTQAYSRVTMDQGKVNVHMAQQRQLP